MVVARLSTALRALPRPTERLTFRWWTDTKADALLAFRLWSDHRVHRLLGPSLRGATREQTDARLQLEIIHGIEHGVQYWPVFDGSEKFVGVVGLRIHDEYPELGFHLRHECWRQGYAVEAASSVLDYAFSTLALEFVVAGHHPANVKSQRTIERLGFTHTHLGEFEGDPDVLYELRAAAWREARQIR